MHTRALDLIRALEGHDLPACSKAMVVDAVIKAMTYAKELPADELERLEEDLKELLAAYMRGCQAYMEDARKWARR